MKNKISVSLLNHQNLFPNHSAKNRGRFKKTKDHKLIDNVIKSIYENGPASLLELRLISKIVNSKINVWQEEVLTHTFNGRSAQKEVDVQYRCPEGRTIGHWCLKGGKDPSPNFRRRLHHNDCLYAVVASQIGWDPAELRLRAARAARAIGRHRVVAEDVAMLGGARYSGRSARDAGYLLDASQNGQCHPEGSRGHPRGHASFPAGRGSTDSIEAYSYGRWRSGFLSRDDQDLVAHFTLITDSAERLMDHLNGGQYKVAEHIGRYNLDYDPLPLAQIWDRGERQGSPSQFHTVVLVGKHFLNRHNDSSADIFVLTFYPIV